MTPEELLETGKKLLNYLTENRLPIALIAVLVSGLAIVTVTHFKKKTREYEKAWKTIGDVTSEVSVAEFQAKEAKNEALNWAIQEYKKILEGPPAGTAAPWALFQLGNTLYVAKKYDEALDQYKNFLQHYSSHPIAPLVRQSIGYAYEEKGQYDAAIQYLQGNALKDNPYFAAQEKWDIGRCLEKMGKLEEARKTYLEAVRLAPQSPWGGLAQYRLDRMK
ncbi:MAG TPA: tetratricopeptide repeat protein [Candidatus Hypogeohydataceae bacterium YC41]